MLPEIPDELISTMWRTFNDGLIKDMYPSVPANFMRNPGIENTMHTRGAEYTKDRMYWLEEYYKCNFDFLSRMLHETAVGEPYISVDRYYASDVTVGHLFHLAKYKSVTNNNIPGRGVIVEWGGGYGNMARMVKTLFPDCTYIIIDTPIMSHIQHYYLGYFTNTKMYDGEIKKGVVNIVSLNHIESLSFDADMFLSTWALNESTEACGEYVKKRNWFGAEQFLLAYLHGSYNVPLIESIGGKIVDVDFLPPNKYMMV
jgi:hypothetical protein